MPEAADAERVFRDMAGQGNKLIFGTTFGYMEPMLKVAADLKDVKFEHATGYKQADNMRTYDSRTYEGAYMAGVIAGGMTKTNTLGVVGSIPIPEVIRNINSFTLGAQSVNPKVKTKVVWVNEWFNPPKETEAAQSLLNGGADVLMQNTDSSAVLQTAGQGRQVRLRLGQRHDRLRAERAPGLGDHQLGAVLHQGDRRTRSTAPGRAAAASWWGVKEGAIDIVSISDKVPADIKTKVESVKAGLKDGSFVIWKGPITSNDGKEVLAAGTQCRRQVPGRHQLLRQGRRGQGPGRREEVTARGAVAERRWTFGAPCARLRRIPRSGSPSCCARCRRPSCTSTSRARSSPS